VISDGVAVIYANKAVADMLGVTDPKELMGKGFRRVVP
jgi:PAS domain-containing protein